MPEYFSGIPKKEKQELDRLQDESIKFGRDYINGYLLWKAVKNHCYHKTLEHIAQEYILLTKKDVE